ncbi:hypothetical protein HPB48_011178 [Haemaphysalis longicornis]|uniref:Uncharacterized protein n=1 Tax=Haemaphysalis longicornis TaxID=44386 RepID=A0A9J6GJX5_HAELO|nr:hypothetical protein HPB48_011178 [Haemaphysalis longicornis]
MFSLLVAQYHEFAAFNYSVAFARPSCSDRDQDHGDPPRTTPAPRIEYRRQGSAANPNQQFGASPGRRTAGGQPPAADELSDALRVICPALAKPRPPTTTGMEVVEVEGEDISPEDFHNDAGWLSCHKQRRQSTYSTLSSTARRPGTGCSGAATSTPVSGNSPRSRLPGALQATAVTERGHQNSSPTA